MTPLDSYRAVVIGYAALGVVLAAIFSAAVAPDRGGDPGGRQACPRRRSPACPDSTGRARW